MVDGTLLFLIFIGFSLPQLGLLSTMMIRSDVVPDPLVWSAGARPKKTSPLCAVRDWAFLSGPPGTWDSGWVTVPPSVICPDDIARWPHTPDVLVKFVAFLGILHWFVGSVNLGVGGISYVELLTLYELWVGERLSLENAQPRCLLPARPL